ncbi:MAG: Loki-CTERM sorting domain-containing protein, partial [Candidatus Hodarchaeales archaeon]
NNVKYNNRGIELEKSSDNNTISENNVNSNSRGIYLESYTESNTISRNNVTNNTYGIVLDYNNNDNNLVFMNCFLENTLNAGDYGLNNQWDNGTVGNFWDDYTGVDSDGDGIGDVPFNITGFGNSQDNFPLMHCPYSTTQEGVGIPGYNLLFLLSILSIVAILISRKLKKSQI